VPTADVFAAWSVEHIDAPAFAIRREEQILPIAFMVHTGAPMVQV